VDKNPQLGFALILQLTGVHGSSQFDKLTKTKTVEGILGSMNADGVQTYVEHLLDQINSLCVFFLFWATFCELVGLE
jgi:DNA polymerase phi